MMERYQYPRKGGKMITKIIGRRAFRIALGTIAIVLLLQSVNYVWANPTQQINNGSSETGVTYTQEVPFSIESIAEVKERESRQPVPSPMQKAIPFQRGPPPKELKHGTAPLNPQSAPLYEPTAWAPALGSSFIGLSDNGMVIPPDTMGAVGPLHLVETLNSEVGFFNKSTGALISNVSLQTFWSSLGTGSGQPDYSPFDPKVIYDQHSGRFIAVTMGGSSSPNSWLMLAVSATSDPTGTWYKWAIDADTDGGAQLFNNWADYPGFGVDANYVYVTANMFSNTNTYQYSKVWVVPKTQLLNGNASITVTEFRNPTGSYFTMQPAHVFGSSSTEYFVHEDYGCPDPVLPCLRLNNITFPGGTPTWNSMGYIVVNSYSSSNFPNAPQLGSSNGIATNDRRLLNAIFRNGSLWTTHTVYNSTGAKTEVAWYQINPANASPSSPYGTPVQQGRVSDANRWYYFPSIAVNSNGDVGIGSSGSSTSEYAGAYYTARNASDASGTMQSVALLKAGLAPYYKTYSGTSNRWGDYSATVIDPSDNTTFWTLQEYAGTSNLWGTWWGKFALATIMPSLSISASPTTVTVGVPANVTFTVTSNGTAVSGATVTLSGNASGSNTTDINGITILTVNATSAGTIIAAANKTGYTSGSTAITASAAVTVVGNDTIGVYRPGTSTSSGTFYLSNNNIVADTIIQYGQMGDIPVVGDWNKSGKTQVGVYRPGTSTSPGTFYLRNVNDAGIAYGQMSDIPVAGDWNGDGNFTIGVYRPGTSTSSGTFYLSNNNIVADTIIQYGQMGDIPVVGDWNKSGKTQVGVYRPGTSTSPGTFYLRNVNDAGIAYGQMGDIPVVGDWDGNGNTTVGIYRNGMFYLRNSNDGGVANLAFAYGQSGDTPAVGDWDGQ